MPTIGSIFVCRSATQRRWRRENAAQLEEIKRILKQCQQENRTLKQSLQELRVKYALESQATKVERRRLMQTCELEVVRWSARVEELERRLTGRSKKEGDSGFCEERRLEAERQQIATHADAPNSVDSAESPEPSTSQRNPEMDATEAQFNIAKLKRDQQFLKVKHELNIEKLEMELKAKDDLAQRSKEMIRILEQAYHEGSGVDEELSAKLGRMRSVDRVIEREKKAIVREMNKQLQEITEAKARLKNNINVWKNFWISAKKTQGQWLSLSAEMEEEEIKGESDDTLKIEEL
ncbi:hypothetical protein CAPTEDRAFT_196055 [Capitella teleta]|uniref:Uncharacterized protein n=1 Tax=Capitella teleta TaxID=283909 RepID=R7TU22_CAPTE|nr:hypothetical protein CAPTEDRAFT_196055 [Capitella teleta]|eukprot:ELT97174.1 hypothetical protein CAPTEDRAFT_196055 [Capitella teleta]